MRQYQFPRGLSAAVHDHLTDVELAYIAGLIDGEGCIMSSHPKNNSNPLSLAVTMIHRPTITWLHEKCGGAIRPHTTRQANARQGWTWYLKGVRTYSLLARVASLMHTKADEALVALALGQTFWRDNVQGRVTAETLEMRRRFGQQLRELKRREWPTA